METLVKDHVPEATALLTRAFDEDPYFRFVAPDPEKRAFLTSEVMQSNVEIAIASGCAFGLLDDGAVIGVCLWFSPGDYPPHATTELAARGRAVGRTLIRWARERETHVGVLTGALRMSALMDEAHPRTEPYYYLQVLAVDTDRQGRGLGSGMLRETTAQADRDGRVAIIETSKPANRKLYERFGFRTVRTITLDGSPPVWSMRREPE